MLVAGTATTAANQIYFEFGRRQGPKFLGAYPAAVRRVEKFSGWVPRFGGPVVLPCMSRWRFAAWNVAGAILWTSAIGTAGYLGAHAMTMVLADIKRHEVAMAALIAISTLVLTAWVTRTQDWSDFWRLRRFVFKGRCAQ